MAVNKKTPAEAATGVGYRISQLIPIENIFPAAFRRIFSQRQMYISLSAHPNKLITFFSKRFTIFLSEPLHHPPSVLQTQRQAEEYVRAFLVVEGNQNVHIPSVIVGVEAEDWAFIGVGVAEVVRLLGLEKRLAHDCGVGGVDHR